MGTWIIANWQAISGIILAAIGIWKYLDTRNRELAWRRTEFLCEQLRLIDEDKELAESILILEGRHPTIDLKTLYENINQEEFSDYYRKFDKLLNFLSRFAYAYFDSKTLSLAEVRNFGWYLEKINNDPYLSKYSEENGLHDLLELWKQIDEY